MTSRDIALAESIKEIIGAIALQAVEDWEELKYGEIEVVFSMGQYLERTEVKAFLLSEEFEAFMELACPNVSIGAVRQKLKLTGGDETKKELKKGEIETLFLMADNGMSVPRAAKAGFYNRKTIYERLRNIKAKTGIDPRDFYGLQILLRMVKGERIEDGREEDEEL